MSAAAQELLTFLNEVAPAVGKTPRELFIEVLSAWIAQRLNLDGADMTNLGNALGVDVVGLASFAGIR
jgi:hypothetical protein